MTKDMYNNLLLWDDLGLEERKQHVTDYVRRIPRPSFNRWGRWNPPTRREPGWQMKRFGRD
jgi:hypothetical protein